MKREAVALCRVSSQEQRIGGNSLESQQKHVYEFAHNVLHCEIDKIWSLDVSSKAGKNMGRKDLEEIKAYSKQNTYIKYFILDKVNRLMRESDVFFWYLVELKKLGVKIVFAEPSQQYLNEDDQASKLRLMIEAWQAEADNKERTSTTIARMKDRYLCGYRLSAPLQGYRRTSVAGLHEPDPERFILLQSSMRDILSGRFTVYEALENLLKHGYSTPGGKELRIDKFRTILQHEYYAGRITVNRWKNDERFVGIKGLHKPMITYAEHLELINIVTGKKRIFERKKDRKDFPLSNIGFCACGGKLVGFMHGNGNGWRSPKYRCRSCGKQYHAGTVHESLDKLLNNIEFNLDNEPEFMKSIKNVWSEEESHTLKKMNSLKQNLESMKLEKNQITKKIALNRDASMDDDYMTILVEVKQQIENLELEIQDLSNIDDDFIRFVRFCLKFMDEKMIIWSKLDKVNRIKCKQLAFPREIIVNFSEKVCTPQISPILKLIDNIKEANNAPKSHLVEVAGVAPASKRLKTYHLQV